MNVVVAPIHWMRRTGGRRAAHAFAGSRPMCVWSTRAGSMLEPTTPYGTLCQDCVDAVRAHEAATRLREVEP